MDTSERALFNSFSVVMMFILEFSISSALFALVFVSKNLSSCKVLIMESYFFKDLDAIAFISGNMDFDARSEVLVFRGTIDFMILALSF